MKVYPLSNFRISDTVLLITVTLLYIRAPRLAYFVPESLYLLTTFTHFPHSPPLRYYFVFKMFHFSFLKNGINSNKCIPVEIIQWREDVMIWVRGATWLRPQFSSLRGLPHRLQPPQQTPVFSFTKDSHLFTSRFLSQRIIF